jgi:hypothetical protein
MSEGTGKWRVPGVPHKGWQCVDIKDLNRRAAVCEMCESITIRYVHYMKHPDYGKTLGCGCICAGHMEEDLAGARQREKSFKARLSRRAKWLHRVWQISRNGNEYINVNGINVVVYRRGQTWGARFIDKITGYKRFLEQPYVSANEAKLAAFDAVTEYSESDACKNERDRRLDRETTFSSQELLELLQYFTTGAAVPRSKKKEGEQND